MQINRFSIGGLFGLVALVGFSIASTPAVSDDTLQKEKLKPETIEFFEAKVRPLLFQRCFGCHGEKQQMGGLRLDSLAHTIKGNSAGPAVIPGKPDNSPLIQVIRYDGKVKMPPAGKLSKEESAILTQWVEIGAPWPGSKASDTKGANSPAVDKQSMWALHPVKKPPIPVVKNKAWVRTPVDAFILSKLEQKHLNPSPSLDRRNLLRRVSYDLTGLAPTAAETASFLADKSPNAYETVIDRLLASPRYGERWGRYWLDVARYADTRGYNFVSDPVYHHAYNYRDWVIQALNEDMPYNTFVKYQLAADLMPMGDDHRNLAALGFLTLGRRFLNDIVLITDDRIDTIGRGLMGLSIACARCHNHKFDPILAKDYYSMYGILASTREPDPPVIISPKELREPYETYQKKLVTAERERDDTVLKQVRALRTKKETLSKQVQNTLQFLREDAQPNDKEFPILFPAFEEAVRNRLSTLKQEIAEMKKSPPKTPEFAHTLEEQLPALEPYVFLRGNPGNRGETTTRHFLAVLGGSETAPYKKGSGRLELAESIISNDNPLTGRVFVNRVWMHHFDNALVRTPSDFGTRGELPTHPEMLDYLTARFIEEGWSLKKLHKWILLSNTYKQSSENNPKAFVLDPENRLVWRQSRVRLDFEAMRDALLNVSGQLDPKLGGASVDILNAPYTKRRTVYSFIERQNLPGIFRTFDLASPDSSTPQRFKTTVPQQALYMLNSPFVMEVVRNMAGRIEFNGISNEGRVKKAYDILFQRAPTPIEIQLALQFISKPSVAAAPVWQYGYGGVEGQKVTNFTPLPHWSGAQWQGSAAFPDSKLSYLMLNKQGGHPGADLQHAAIRRWVSPIDGSVKIEGSLYHPEKQGDGVRGTIVSSRIGKIGEWNAHTGRTDTSVQDIEVKKGDTLDFVVDCRGSQDFDGFTWVPTIKQMQGSGAKTVALGRLLSWSAESDFGGPVAQQSFSRWEKYLQLLMMTNEFCFVE